jgi:hypothetical protein
MGATESQVMGLLPPSADDRHQPPALSRLRTGATHTQPVAVRCKKLEPAHAAGS